MNHPNQKNVYELVAGEIAGGRLKETANLGFAYLYGNSRCYEVRLSNVMGENPRTRYYIMKNRRTKLDYIVYSKRPKPFRNNSGADDIVGTARLSENLKTHLEININKAPAKIFMSLYPLEF